MPRPRTPTALMELRGSFDRHPERKRPNEPDPGPLDPTPPAHLPDEIKETWTEVIGIIPPGVAKSSDSVALEALSFILWNCRDREWRDTPMMLRLEQLLGRFGLTPASRKSAIRAPRVADARDERDNPFANL